MFLSGIVDHSQDPIVKVFGDWAGDINVASVIMRVVLAVILGGIIGAERATKHHVAGLRTYILVCLGACIAMLTNEFISKNADVARLGAGVLTGIGFLGAGTIMVTSRNQVRGLTTAAALWASGAVGLAIGIGFYTLALSSAAMIIIALIFLPKIEGALQKNASLFDIHVELLSRPDLKSLLDYVRSQNIAVLSIAYDPAYANTGLSVYSLALKANKTKDKKRVTKSELFEGLKALEYVNYVEFMD